VGRDIGVESSEPRTNLSCLMYKCMLSHVAFFSLFPRESCQFETLEKLTQLLGP
jgi:hypothetical protein